LVSVLFVLNSLARRIPESPPVASIIKSQNSGDRPSIKNWAISVPPASKRILIMTRMAGSRFISKERIKPNNAKKQKWPTLDRSHGIAFSKTSLVA